jgi:hypothetical protein
VLVNPPSALSCVDFVSVAGCLGYDVLAKDVGDFFGGILFQLLVETTSN